MKNKIEDPTKEFPCISLIYIVILFNDELFTTSVASKTKYRYTSED